MECRVVRERYYSVRRRGSYKPIDLKGGVKVGILLQGGAVRGLARRWGFFAGGCRVEDGSGDGREEGREEGRLYLSIHL